MKHPPPTRRKLIAAMALSVAAVLAASLWSSGQEMDAALSRLAKQQAFLALTVAHDLNSRQALLEENARLAGEAANPQGLFNDVLSHLTAVEREGQMVVLVRRVGEHAFRSPKREVTENAALHAAFARGAASVVIPREQAPRLGLSPNRAIAGLAEVVAANGRALQIAVITSAAPERQRVYRTQWRNVLTGLTAIGVVLWFGRMALVQQRRELDLAAQLARSQLERDRDAQLARADRLAMMAAMSTGIAHELGSPLGVMMGRLEQLALLPDQDEATARALRSMNEQTVRMGGIIRGLLGLARGETPHLEHTAADQLVHAAAELVRHRFYDVRLEQAVAPSLPEVAVDQPLFVQALTNLLVNACQASKSGDTVTLRVTREGGQMLFEVCDHGEGIAPEVARRATEPFFTTRANQGGTGLGLAIANEITQHHGGSLALVSSPAGTRAQIRIPLARTEGGTA